MEWVPTNGKWSAYIGAQRESGRYSNPSLIHVSERGLELVLGTLGRFSTKGLILNLNKGLTLLFEFKLEFMGNFHILGVIHVQCVLWVIYNNGFTTIHLQS